MSDSLKNSAYVYDSIANDAFDLFALPSDIKLSGTLEASRGVFSTLNVTSSANITGLVLGSLASMNVSGTANVGTLSTSSLNITGTSNLSNLTSSNIQGSAFLNTINVSGTSNLSNLESSNITGSGYLSTLNVSGTSNLSNLTISNIYSEDIRGHGFLDTLNVSGTSNLFTIHSNISQIDTLFVSNLLISGSSFNVAQNILTSNSITIVNYGTGPAFSVTQASGTPDQQVAYFTALGDHPALKILGTGQCLFNYIDGALFADTEIEVRGNVYISDRLILPTLNVTGIANVSDIYSTSYRGSANLTSINVSGTSNLINIVSSNITGSGYLSTLNVSGTSNLVSLISSNIRGAAILGGLNVTAQANLLALVTDTINTSGLSNLMYTEGTSLNIYGTSNLANLVSSNITVSDIRATGIVGTSLNVSGTSNLATLFGTSVNVSGTSNLANLVSSNIFGDVVRGTGIVGTSLNVSGTSNLANLVSSNVFGDMVRGTGITGTSLNVSGTSNLITIAGTSLNVSGTSNLANIFTNNLQTTYTLGVNQVTFPISYPVVLGGALSDESTTLTTGTKLTFRAPFSFTVSSDIPPLFTLNANSASSNVTFSILKNGSNIYSVNPNVSSVSTFLSSNATPGTLINNSNTFSYLDKIDITIVGVGSGAPNGAKCTIYCD